eukprot:54565_1
MPKSKVVTNDHPTMISPNGVDPAKKPVLASRFSKFARSLIWWKDPANSLVALGIGLLTWYLLTCGGYTVVTLCGYMATLYIGACLLHINGVWLYSRYTNSGEVIKFRHHFPDTEVWVTPADVQSVLEVAADRTNTSLRYFRDIVHCKNMGASLRALSVTIVIAAIGWMFDGVTIVALAYVLSLVVPITYQRNQIVADRAIMKVKLKYSEISSPINKRIEQFLEKRGYSFPRFSTNKHDI